jgi:hypothetical protein
MSEQESHTSGSKDSTSTRSTEKASHQTMTQHPTHQTKNQQYQGHNQNIPVTISQCSAMHQQLSKNLRHQQHQTPATHTMEEDRESYRSQTNTTLASLLLARNNNRPQQIWQLRLLQSDLAHHQLQPLPLHRLPPWLQNELQAIYKPLYGKPLEALEDLVVLETLPDQEDQEDPLLLQLPQLPQQPQHLPIVMTDSWGVYPRLTRETGSSQEPSLTSWFTTSEPTRKSQD